MTRLHSILLAGVVGLVLTTSARADGDIVRLDGKGDASIEEARWGRGYYGGWYGGYRGFGWGGYRGYGWGGSVGWRGGYWGGYRPWYGYYRPWGGWGYSSYYAWAPSVYYYPSYSYVVPTYSYSFFPCATTSSENANVVTLGRPYVPQRPDVPRSSDGTFPYNGGPSVNPMDRAAPTGVPARPNLKRDGLLVSLPANDPYQFRAYGEEAPVSRPTPRPAARDVLFVSHPSLPTTFTAGAR